MKNFKVALYISILALLCLFGPSCTPSSNSGEADSSPDKEEITLTVFAASSLATALTELGTLYEAQNEGVTIRLSFAGSQTLRTQIQDGASADIFVSANWSQMEALLGSEQIREENIVDFTSNTLAVVLPSSNDRGLETLDDLTEPGVKIVIGTEEVPVGNYTRQALEKLNSHPDLGPDYSKQLMTNIVSTEQSVRQIVTKVQLGEIDAAFVFVSNLVSAGDDVIPISIPAEYNVKASYYIVPIAQRANVDASVAFIDFLSTDEAKTILTKWGFDGGQE